jgi:hypothetical protein
MEGADGEALSSWEIGQVLWDELVFVTAETGDYSAGLLLSVGDQQVEVLPIQLHGSGEYGLFLFPAETRISGESPTVTIAGIDPGGGSVQVECKLIELGALAVSALYQGPPLGEAEGYTQLPVLFSGQVLPLDCLKVLDLPGVQQWVLQTAGSQLDEAALLVSELDMQTASEGLGAAPAIGLKKARGAPKKAPPASRPPGLLQGPPPPPIRSEAERLLVEAQAAKANLQRVGKGGQQLILGGAAPPGAKPVRRKAVTISDLADVIQDMQRTLGSEIEGLSARVQVVEGVRQAGPQPQQPGASSHLQSPAYVPTSANLLTGRVQHQAPAPLHPGAAFAHGSPAVAEDPTLLLARALAKLVRPEDSLLENEGGEISNSLARGSSAVANIVSSMRHKPTALVNQFEALVKSELGVYYDTQPWSLDQHADLVIRDCIGHRVLKKYLRVLAHAYELGRIENSPPRVQAFLAQSYKAGTEAVAQNGDWSLAWPLLGLVDPDERSHPVTSAGERVALVALAKERQTLKAAMAAPKIPNGKAGAAAGVGGKGGAALAQE